MPLINILTTNEIGEEMEPALHGGVQLTFGRIVAGEIPKLLDGPVWAFVDWVMPELSGLEMCRRLRADPKTADAHLTIVLDSDNVEDRRRALQAGADDYLLGPLSQAQVLDRVLAVSAANNTIHRPSPLIHSGDFEIDHEAHVVRYQKRPIKAQSSQFPLLCYFIENANRVLTRQELIQALRSVDCSINDRTVDKWVVRLRRSLRDVNADILLRTVHGLGYVLDIV